MQVNDSKKFTHSLAQTFTVGFRRRVSAWSTENGIALGQIATEEKSNEITAIPELPDQIDVSGCVVTIDAITGVVVLMTGAVVFLCRRRNYCRKKPRLKRSAMRFWNDAIRSFVSAMCFFRFVIRFSS